MQPVEMGLHYAFMQRGGIRRMNSKTARKREAGKNNKTLIADLHGFVLALGTSSVV